MMERTLRISDELQARLVRQAKREERSQNSLIIIALKAYLDRAMLPSGADPSTYVEWYEQED